MAATNLLFDLGGVIMDINRLRCVEAFRRLGMASAADMLGEYAQQGPFGALESGEITPAEFREAVRERIAPERRAGVTDAAIDAALNSFLIGIPLSRLRALESLSVQGYKLGLLSNTNAIMWNSFIAEEFRKDGHDAAHYFPLGMVTSFEARVMKPQRAIFDITARQLGIDPADTLFLDDSAANIAAAREAGYQGLVVEPGKEFTDVITAWQKSQG